MASSLDQLKIFTNNIQAAKGEFSQQSPKENSKKLGSADLASGVFFFKWPNKFIWAYQKPYTQVLKTDGSKLYIYDKELRQVIIKTLDNELESSPLAILFSSNFSSEKFKLRDRKYKNGLEWVEIVPKDKGANNSFDYMAIGLKDNLPQMMKLRNLFGQVSLLKFKKVVKNPLLPSRKFQFLLPKDVEIFNQ
jgi:outer membrane lipoprotein carrier protein